MDFEKSWLVRWGLAAIGILACVAIVAACGGDDDDDDDADEEVGEIIEEGEEDSDEGEEGEEEESEESEEAEDEEAEDDDSGIEGDLEEPPIAEGDYLTQLTQTFSDLAADSPECSEIAGDTNAADFEVPDEIEIPEECEDLLEEAIDRLEDLDPPEECESYNQLLIDLYNDALDDGSLDISALQEPDNIEELTECFSSGSGG